MALSTGKRIASGICFGRKVSSTVPRESTTRDETRFQNCNRLGCSIKQMFVKGVEIDPEERPHSSYKASARMGLKRFKDRKKVTSLLQKEKPETKSEPRTPVRSEQEQEVADASPNESGGSAGSPPSERRKRIARCIKYGNRGASSSSQKSNTAGSSSSPPPPPPTSALVSTNDKNIGVPSKRRGPSLGPSSSRPKAGVGSSSRPSNVSSARSTTAPGPSISRPRSLRRAVPTRESNEDDLSYGVFRMSNSSGNVTQSDSSGGALQSAYGCSEGDPHDWSNTIGISEALYELNGLAWGAELPLELMAFEATLLDRRAWRDQHRDMRLDIDNMTYEELLALGEKIGTVSTALTEEALSKCIKRAVYGSPSVMLKNSNRGDDDIRCSICQEEYVAGDEVGKLFCSHLYHVDCVLQWFQLKNWCPICKSSVTPS